MVVKSHVFISVAKVKSLSVLLQGPHLLTKKVDADGGSLRAEMNTEAFGKFCKSISPLSKSFLLIYTQKLQ